jgi:predicted Zn-dependent protease
MRAVRHLFTPAVICITLFLCWPVGASQVDRDIDYYNPGPRAGTIRIAEQYHLTKARSRISDQKWDRYSVWQELDFVLRVSPNHPIALDWMVRLCGQWKHPRCALDEYFEKAVAINPRVATTYVLKGIYQLKFDRPKQAVESFRTALEIDPKSTNGHYNLGLAYFDLKEYTLSNAQAQAAYALGAPFSGLREKLQAVGRWDPSARAGAVAPALREQTGETNSDH